MILDIIKFSSSLVQLALKIGILWWPRERRADCLLKGSVIDELRDQALQFHEIRGQRWGVGLRRHDFRKVLDLRVERATSSDEICDEPSCRKSLEVGALWS